MSHDITVQVTPDSSEASGFRWEYKHDDETSFSPLGPDANLFIIDIDASPEIVVTLVANGQPGDTLVFSGSLVEFTDQDGNPISSSSNPFKMVSGEDTPVLSFTDDNTSPPLGDAIFRVKFFAKYNGDLIASPDPTIVNDGIDHHGNGSSQEKTQPAVAAV